MPLWYEKLERAMHDRGLTPYRLAQALNIAASRFTLWKQGRGKPTMDQVIALCDRLDIKDVKWLMDDRIGLDDYELPPLEPEAVRAIIAFVEVKGGRTAMKLIMKAIEEDQANSSAGTARPVRVVDLSPRPPEETDETKNKK